MRNAELWKLFHKGREKVEYLNASRFSLREQLLVIALDLIKINCFPKENFLNSEFRIPHSAFRIPHSEFNKFRI
jgi:hypothetical protein